MKSAGPLAGNAASDDPDTIEARKRFKEGAAAGQLGRWPDAYRAYLAAWKVKQHWQIAGSLGQAELEVARYREAAEHLTLFLQQAKDVDPGELNQVRGWLARAEAKVGVLRVTAEELGAEILVDDVSVGRAPVGHTIYVDPGKHAVKGLFKECTAKIDEEVAAGRSKDLVLRCEPSVTIAKPPAPRPDGGPSKVLLAVGGATAGTALIAGVVFSIVSKNKARAADSMMLKIKANYGQYACALAPPAAGCEELHRAREPQYTFGNLALWSFVGAGVAGAATLIYGLATPRSAPRTALQAAPIVTPKGGGMAVVGTW